MESDIRGKLRALNKNQKRKEKNLNDSWLRDSIWNIGEKIWHTFAVVGPTNGFGKHHGDVDALDFVAILHMAVLWNCIRHDNGFEASVVDARNGWTAEDSVCKNGIHLRGAGFKKLLGSVANCAARVGHVVDENRDSLSHVTNEHHWCDFVGLLALFVNQSELNVQSVCNRRDTLGATSIWRHDDRVPPVGDILFDPLQDSGLGIKIIDGNVKETLKRWGNIKLLSRLPRLSCSPVFAMREDPWLWCDLPRQRKACLQPI